MRNHYHKFAYRKDLKYIFFLLALLLLIPLINSCKQNQISKSDNEEFASLIVSTEQSIVAAEANISYDTQALEYVGVSSVDNALVSGHAANGELTVGLISTQKLEEKLFVVGFRVKSANAKPHLGSLISLSLNQEKIELTTNKVSWITGLPKNPVENYDLKAQANNLSAQAIIAKPTLKASLADFPLGDFNESSDVSTVDALAVLQVSTSEIVTPSDHQLYHSDVDSNGVVNIFDAVLVLLKATNAKLEASLQVAPLSLSFSISEKGLILVGNSGNMTLPKVNITVPDDVTATDISTTNAVGKVFELASTKQLDNGAIVFDADLAGEKVISLTTTPSNVATEIKPFDFKVIDAEYVKSLDAIVMVSAQPNQLHLYDVSTHTDEVVDLNLAPSSVSVSPDGKSAAVSHNARISLVDLINLKLIKVLDVSADVSDVVLAGNGYAYAFPRTDQHVRIHNIHIESGVEEIDTSYSIYAGTVAKLHPNGEAIYGADNGLSPSDIEKYNILDGPAKYLYDSPYHGDYDMCGNLWFSEDGLRVFTKCGNVFYSSNVKEEDMVYNGSLEQIKAITDMSHVATVGKVLVIPETTRFDDTDQDISLHIYSYEFLGFERKITFPRFAAPTIINSQGHGRFVFVNSANSKIYVIVQANESSGILNDFGVVEYPLD